MRNEVRRSEIAKEVRAIDVSEPSKVEHDVEFLYRAFQLFDERVERLDRKERQAVIAVLSNRIRDTLQGVHGYVESRLAEESPSRRRSNRSHHASYRHPTR